MTSLIKVVKSITVIWYFSFSGAYGDGIICFFVEWDIDTNFWYWTNKTEELAKNTLFMKNNDTIQEQ